MSSSNRFAQFQWRGGFPGSYSGEVQYTRNIDLSTSPGRIILADKMLKHVDSTDTNMSNLIVATKFIRTNADGTDRYWAICGNDTTGGRVFKTDSATPLGTWAEDTLTSDTAPTTVLDGEIHESANGEQRLFVTLPSDVAVLNTSGNANKWDVNWGTTIPSTAISLSSSTLHPIARLQRLLAIGNGNTLSTIDKDDIVTNARITVPYGFSIRNIYASSDRFWIGCTNTLGTNAKIIEWDGTSLTYNNEYDIVGTTPLSGFIVDNIPFFISDYGYIFRYSGGSFKVDQQFPLVEESLPTLSVSTYGTTVNSSKVSILCTDTSDTDLGTNEYTTASSKFRAGIWEYDVNTRNLNHKFGIGASDVGSTTTLPDFGQSPLQSVGALNFSFTTNANILFAGAKIYTAYKGTSMYGMFRQVQNKARYQSTGINRGYLVTTYVPIGDIEALWEGLWIKFKRFIDSSNKIVVKGRIKDPLVVDSADLSALRSRNTVQAPGTWTSTTTFTCVVPTGIVTGNEVEVLSGNGAGCLAHISTLSQAPNNSATITVTVDEAIPTLNGVGSRDALFRFDNWTKIDSITSTTVGNQKLVIPSQLHGEFLQLKVELRGFEVEIDQIIPTYKPKTRVEML